MAHTPLRRVPRESAATSGGASWKLSARRAVGAHHRVSHALATSRLGPTARLSEAGRENTSLRLSGGEALQEPPGLPGGEGPGAGESEGGQNLPGAHCASAGSKKKKKKPTGRGPGRAGRHHRSLSRM